MPEEEKITHRDKTKKSNPKQKLKKNVACLFRVNNGKKALQIKQKLLYSLKYIYSKKLENTKICNIIFYAN